MSTYYELYVCVLTHVGVQTPNCIRQTVYDAVALDYQPVTVLVDATAAATPDIHLGNGLHLCNVCLFNFSLFFLELYMFMFLPHSIVSFRLKIKCKAI